ncbi:MAG: glutamate synthase large subunit [Candidatus Omnitrophica bacterium]|nr:glutamate synthase large subunit [Candidatus Omnitrophota bacterium]
MNKRESLEKYGLYDRGFEHDSCGVGFVCHIRGCRSHEIIQQGLEVLRRLAHRGATGADPDTGDGAGVLIQIPHAFFARVCLDHKIDLPSAGFYGTGLIFMPQDTGEREFCRNIVSKIIRESGQRLLGWRKVPLDPSCIGKVARKTQPVIEQVFIASEGLRGLRFERQLYIIRKQIENIIRAAELKQKTSFYITNLSSRTFSYKGLLKPKQLEDFFPDLKDPLIESAICLVHSRYSTNTFPTWDLSQPFRFLAHNGEINTLRGNINWMRAKEGLLKSEFFGKDIEKLKPVIVPAGSDSAAIDNLFELLVLSGRSLSHAMMMLIPSAWEQDILMEASLRDFYKFHACLMEPWDGPSSIAFTDGVSIGAVLDRNGLRPGRYIVTKDDYVVMASEVGVLDIAAENILASGRLKPGEMFFIDTACGRIVSDEEIKKTAAEKKPYGRWLKNNLVELEDLPVCEAKFGRQNMEDACHRLKARYNPPDIITFLKAFGYTREDLKLILKPMAENAEEPIGSMGCDTPHAVLSKRPQLLYNYFKQLFAQVTNPAIDPIREELVMSTECFFGPRRNILEESQRHCRKLHLRQPILSNEDLEKIRQVRKGFKSKTVSLLFEIKKRNGFQQALESICAQAERAIRNGYAFIILSDRGVSQDYAALPALLAIGAVHQYLVKRACRSQVSIILESAEPREVHHFALLFGFGAGAVNPYLAFESLYYLAREGEIDLGLEQARKNYIKAVNKGILKILSKMGISTLQSYRGAQIFEAVGLHPEVIKCCFAGTTSRIGGATMDIISQETILRHKEAYPEGRLNPALLSTGGLYQWKKDGEFHLWNPDTISLLQDSVRKGDYNKYKEFSGLINDQSANPTTLRSLLKFSSSVKKIPIEEVETVSEIVKRFAAGAMSFGSISLSAHETIAIAMNRLEAKSNTGEGGEDPARFLPLNNGDSARSAIKQVASGRFGVTTNYLVNADELQIKIAQGAKPGEGGQLPGHKVSVSIAKTRYTTPGVTLISPPPHHDIYSIEDLAQLIFDLKNTNPRARVSVKLVSEIGVGTIAAGVAKGHADMILISGGDGGTGASPLSSIRNAGLPWELGLSEAHQTLVLNDLRSRVRLQTDGQMRTGRDVAIAAILGAEEFGFCSAALVVLGCVMLRHCHLNNCSLGVATQDECLEKRFQGKPEYLVNYFNFVAQELREIMSSLGVRKVEELIGRTDFLGLDKGILPWKAQKIDYSRILYSPKVDATVARFCQLARNNGIEEVLDKKLLKLSAAALNTKTPVKLATDIKNTDRATAAMLSGEVCRRFGEQGLPEDTIHINFKGTAGQSFGAWLAKGITLELEGMGNDYVGKGISGGKIIIYPDKKVNYKAEENIIIGNTAFYGAIFGEAYIRGAGGERFCIRNSGLFAVVEGVGDHACEYMTGGKVVILGNIGKNFAAGMSGGIAYVYDPRRNLESKCNKEMVDLDKPDADDLRQIYRLLRNHYKYTQSEAAYRIIDNFSRKAHDFIKVIPKEYKRILGVVSRSSTPADCNSGCLTFLQEEVSDG